MNSIKVMVPLGDVPTGGMVSKSMGSRQFTVQDEIKIYGPEVSEQKTPIRRVNAGSCARLLLGEDLTSMVAMSSSTEVVWHTEDRTLCDYLCDRIAEEDAR